LFTTDPQKCEQEAKVEVKRELSLVHENIHDDEDKTNSDAEEEVCETKQDLAIRSP